MGFDRLVLALFKSFYNFVSRIDLKKRKIILLNQLIHKGVIIPDTPEYQGLSILIDGKPHKLNPLQEEMAYAWAKKQGTPYVQDLVFIRNFMADFSQALGFEKPLKLDQIDFSELNARVAKEKAAKEALTKEEKKAAAAQRKEIREHLKEEYGFAVADGERIALGGYMTEPSGIFMGRGKHPLRGRWKAGAKKKDVTLNLSPDAFEEGHIVPEEWKEIIWQPESLWIAKWDDELTGKTKYIWLHDTAPIKQEREAQKFDKAIELRGRLEEIRSRIQENLTAESDKRRRIATACYLIDKLCLRVGDEKDPEEADTVGATTLRPEHIKIKDEIIEFRFLGKDSVLWDKKLKVPSVVRENIQYCIDHAQVSESIRKMGRKHPNYNKPQLFYDVTSRNINAFLSEIMCGLSAKVFRTHHASHIVEESLNHSGVIKEDPEYKKWEAAVVANREAAILCNHVKQASKNWSERKKKFKEREQKAKERIKKIVELDKELKQQLKDLKKEAVLKKKTATKKEQKDKIKLRYEKRIESKKSRIEKTAIRLEKANYTLGKLKVQKSIAMENRTWNLGTSQKSYIDPRVFYNWGQEVDYDVLDKYYSKTLSVKHQWVTDSKLNPKAKPLKENPEISEK